MSPVTFQTPGEECVSLRCPPFWGNASSRFYTLTEIARPSSRGRRSLILFRRPEPESLKEGHKNQIRPSGAFVTGSDICSSILGAMHPRSLRCGEAWMCCNMNSRRGIARQSGGDDVRRNNLFVRA